MYPGTSLVGGDQTKEFTAIRQGVIDLAVGSTINWSPQVTELNLFSLPFLMPDYKAMDALTQGQTGKELFKMLEKNGVVPLAWGENGLPRDLQLEARDPDPGGHEGHEVPRRRLAAVQRHLHRAGREPDPDELGRCPAGAARPARSMARRTRYRSSPAPRSMRSARNT